MSPRLPITAAAAGVMIALIGLAAGGRPAAAQDFECPAFDRLPPGLAGHFLHRGPTPDHACRTAQFYLAKAAPAEELLDQDLFAEYSAALDDTDCDAALALLANAFEQAYPDLPSIVAEPENLNIWQARIAWVAYPELVFCGARRDVRAGLKGLASMGLAARPVRDIYEPGYPPPRPLRLRNSGVARLAGLLSVDYGPAYAELARLSADGSVLRLVAEDQYYVARRARFLGVGGEDIDELLVEAAAGLTPEQVAATAREAEGSGSRRHRRLRVE